MLFAQILDDDPPEVWAAAQRLLGEGLDAQQVLGQLSMAIGEHLTAALDTDAGQASWDGLGAALAALPLPGVEEISAALIDVAGDQPGITADAHVAGALDRLGLSGETAEGLVERVLEDLVAGPLEWLPGDRTVVIADLVAGATFTHRFNDAEADLGTLSAGFDLAALSRCDTLTVTTPTTTVEVEVFSVEAGHWGWAGPEGWLAEFEPGDLLVVTAELDPADAAAATVRLERATQEPEVPVSVVEAVRAAYEELMAEPGLPVAGDELWWLLLFTHPELFTRPQAPLGELCEAAGLEVRVGHVAHDESVWRRALWLRRMSRITDEVPELRWQRILGEAVGVLDDPDATVTVVRDALDSVAAPEALDVLADVLIDHYLDPADRYELATADAPGQLFELVDRALAVARRPTERASAHYLAAVLAERSAQPAEAWEHLLAANEALPRLGPVVERCGWYCCDRGDAAGAMRWWDTLNQPHPTAASIAAFTGTGQPSRRGRNEACWCGSGRKTKHCHRNQLPQPALADRVGWLCAKAALWVEHTTGTARAVVADLALSYATGLDDPTDADLDDLDPGVLNDGIEAAFADPLLLDVALHEGGLFGLWLRERGPLLPEDEQLLTAAWSTIDRSVHEVLDTRPGDGLRLRDLATGEVTEVRERTASHDLEVGQRLCARVVPDGHGHQIIGGTFGVRAGHETAVLELCEHRDGPGLCAWVHHLHAPPRIVHQPGLIADSFDTDALQAAIDDLGEHPDPDQAIAVLNEQIRQQAQARWLDEAVPALGGLTPRQAAADPTRREQLERLLNDFDLHDRALPDGFEPITFNTTELRHQLGLT